MATTILGISPGTRFLGIALIKNGELIEYKVRTFKQSWSKDKQEEIIATVEKLCDYYKVTVVALRGIHPLITATNLHDLTIHLVDRLKRKQIKVRRYSIQELKEYCGRIHTSKIGIMEYINETYPELRREYLQERNSSYPYYIKMFEAIIAAKVTDEELNG